MSEAQWDEVPYTMDDYYREMNEIDRKAVKDMLESPFNVKKSPIQERLKEILNIILGKKNEKSG